MRKQTRINDNWYFSKEAKEVPAALPKDWQEVMLPHTWNGTDGQDGGNDYYRGTCYYAKELAREEFENKISYLEFEGVNSSAEVYWNGEKLAVHHGGYSTFRVGLKNIQVRNLLVVAVDNSVNDFVYPQNADFTFYGGIYRGVTLIGVNEDHFELDHYGTPGFKVTPVVKDDSAMVEVEAFVQAKEGCQVEFQIYDAAGALVGSKTVEESSQQTAEGGKCTREEVGKSAALESLAVSAEFVIQQPHLWDGIDDPYLYTAKAKLLKNGEVQDEVTAPFGCRTIHFDPEKGFFLNGRPYPLRGVSRHQDRPEIGNALTLEHHKEDIDLILEMGANTIRLAHYQHAKEFYDLCDQKGLIVWAEIPYITTHMPKGRENTISQMKELIIQNYNHPCIVTWGLSNEITGGGAKDKSLLENHYELNDLVHKMDPTRPTTMAVITMCDMDEEIVHISDIVSYNHYFGWYGGTVDMYGPWFDKFHKKYPNKAIGISEYGCEALNWHNSDPKQGDYSEEYQAFYHEELIKTIAKRPYLWATHVWNMFDFAADARAEGGENGMNHKGLVTFDRKYKKDAFFAYKAWLSKEPFVHICGKRYVDRVEDVTKVTVYTNQPEVELFANGVSVGKQKKGEFPFFYFEVKNQGETTLTAKAGDCTDESRLKKVDTFNEDYRMKEEGEILNWFEITTPTGFYSINDSVGDIMKTFRGKLFILQTAKRLLAGKGKAKKNAEEKAQSKEKAQEKKESKSKNKSGIKLNKTIIEMAKGFTVKRIFSMIPMMGAKPITKEEMLAINAKLNKIRKK